MSFQDLEGTNETRSFTKDGYGDNRLDKSNELNDSMTISEKSRDEYTQTLHNLGGQDNASI